MLGLQTDRLVSNPCGLSGEARAVTVFFGVETCVAKPWVKYHRARSKIAGSSAGTKIKRIMLEPGLVQSSGKLIYKRGTDQWRRKELETVMSERAIVKPQDQRTVGQGYALRREGSSEEKESSD